MNWLNKNWLIKKGFIQIPILFAIIASILAIGSLTYIGYEKLRGRQTNEYVAEEKNSNPENNPIAENIASATSSNQSQLTELDQIKKELEALKQSKNNPTPKSTTTPTASKQTKTYTLPNGAVIDDSGNIISPPTNNSTANSATITAGSRILTGEEVYSLISPSVVYITTSSGAGSGFVIESGKYTITNQHVVKSDQKVNIRLQNGTSFPGYVLGTNKSEDLALIFNGNERPPAVKFGSSGSDSLKIGADVYALGYPLSITEGLYTVTFTKGTLSARQTIKDCPGASLQTDTAINPGNSGGPMVNNKGEVIGVIACGLGSTGAQGIGFAVPSQTIVELIPSLSQYGQSRYEVYPLGSTLTINKSTKIRLEINENQSCVQLGFSGNDLTMCNLYRNYYNDYQWTIYNDW